MNIELSQELIGGLLGGGVAGAIFAGLIAFTTQARLFRREDRYRFNELKREKYASLLVGADTWFREVSEAHRELLITRIREESGDPLVKRPSRVAIGDPAQLKRLAKEVSLLGDDAVMRAATHIFEQLDFVDDIRASLVRFGVHAVWTPDELKARGGSLEGSNEIRTFDESHRVVDDFFHAAKVDLGLAQRRRGVPPMQPPGLWKPQVLRPPESMPTAEPDLEEAAEVTPSDQ